MHMCDYLRPYPAAFLLIHAGHANGPTQRYELGVKYRALLLEEDAPGAKLGVVFYRFWQNVVSAFVEANAEVCSTYV